MGEVRFTLLLRTTHGILSSFLRDRYTVRIKFDLVMAIRKIIRILNLTSRIRDANGSGVLAFIGGVPLRFHSTFALVPLAPEDGFERYSVLGDGHAVA